MKQSHPRGQKTGSISKAFASMFEKHFQILELKPLVRSLSISFKNHVSCMLQGNHMLPEELQVKNESLFSQEYAPQWMPLISILSNVFYVFVV